MPIKKVNGKWQFGDSGKPYIKRADAVEQMKAIKAAQAKAKKK